MAGIDDVAQGGPQVFQFSTDAYREHERVSALREVLGHRLLSLDIEPVSSDEPFRAEAILQALFGVRTTFCSGSAARFERTRTMAAAGDDSIGLVVNFGAGASVSQRGQDAALFTGDAFPILTDAPAVLTSTNHLGILMPRAPLTLRVSHIDRAASRMIPHDNEALRLLVSYLRLMRGEAALASPEVGQTVANHIYDLAALVLGANRDTQHDGLNAVAAARLQAALADIATSFTEPGLNVSIVAHRQGVSARYLQRLLEASGSSFTARVTELRLRRAFALLTKPHASDRRISEIALQSGFSDVSHFNRLFRARFGDTPSGVRQQR